MALPLIKYRGAILAHLKSWYFIGSSAVMIVAFVAMMAARLDLQWFWLLLFAATTVPFAPWASEPVKYFRGGFVSDTRKGTNDASNWIVLSSSGAVSGGWKQQLRLLLPKSQEGRCDQCIICCMTCMPVWVHLDNAFPA